jgi:transcriptional regulator with XRE-family HTH domain
MAHPTEVTEENLKSIRLERNLSQSDLAALLGLEKHHVSKIETGVRALSDAEKKILDWFFFHRLPPGFAGPANHVGQVLEFDEAEWRIISLLSAQAGFQEPRQWIASQIRSYLDHHPKAQEVKAAPASF